MTVLRWGRTSGWIASAFVVGLLGCDKPPGEEAKEGAEGLKNERLSCTAQPTCHTFELKVSNFQITKIRIVDANGVATDFRNDLPTPVSINDVPHPILSQIQNDKLKYLKDSSDQQLIRPLPTGPCLPGCQCTFQGPVPRWITQPAWTTTIGPYQQTYTDPQSGNQLTVTVQEVVATMTMDSRWRNGTCQ